MKNSLIGLKNDNNDSSSGEVYDLKFELKKGNKYTLEKIKEYCEICKYNKTEKDDSPKKPETKNDDKYAFIKNEKEREFIKKIDEEGKLDTLYTASFDFEILALETLIDKVRHANHLHRNTVTDALGKKVGKMIEKISADTKTAEEKANE